MGPHCSGAVRPGRAALLGHSRQHCSKKSSALLKNPEHCSALARPPRQHCSPPHQHCSAGHSALRWQRGAVRGREVRSAGVRGRSALSWPPAGFDDCRARARAGLRACIPSCVRRWPRAVPRGFWRCSLGCRTAHRPPTIVAPKGAGAKGTACRSSVCCAMRFALPPSNCEGLSGGSRPGSVVPDDLHCEIHLDGFIDPASCRPLRA